MTSLSNVTPGLAHFQTERKSDGVELIGKPPNVVLVSSDGDGWRAAKSAQSFSAGRLYFEFEITRDGPTSNTWRIVVGAVPTSFDCSQRSYTCVGSGQGGWGYVGGTGKKYKKQHGEAASYGPTFTTGDVVGVLLDFPNRTISFFKNKIDLGVAFNDLVGPVQLAVSMTAKDSRVTLRSDPEFKEVGSSSERDRLSVLESSFPSKFLGSHIDLSSPFWANPLSELALMGFGQLDALEALLVTGDPQLESQPFRNETDLAKAIDYLFCAPDQRRAKFDEVAKSQPKSSSSSSFPVFTPLPTPPPNSAVDAKLREQFVALKQKVELERKQFDSEKRQLEREMYKEVLTAVIADGCVNRHELDRLEALRHKRHISMHIHESLLSELGVSKEKYNEMIAKAREEEEQLRRLKKDPRTKQLSDKTNECVVCIEKTAEFVILDCMHLCLCEGCRSLFSKPDSVCPTCRRPVKEIRKVY